MQVKEHLLRLGYKDVPDHILADFTKGDGLFQVLAMSENFGFLILTDLKF